LFAAVDVLDFFRFTIKEDDDIDVDDANEEEAGGGTLRLDMNWILHKLDFAMQRTFGHFPQ